MYTKKALIRDPNAPMGRPAAMHLECVCHATVPVPAPFTEERVVCDGCGQNYDSSGYLIEAEASAEPDESMDGDHDSAMASIGWGTDEGDDFDRGDDC